LPLFFTDIKDWVPPFEEPTFIPPTARNPRVGLFQPKGVSSSVFERKEMKIQVKVDLGEAVNTLNPKRVFDFLSAEIDWYPPFEGEERWHSRDFMFFTQKTAGDEIRRDQKIRLGEKAIPYTSPLEDTARTISLWYQPTWSLESVKAENRTIPSKMNVTTKLLRAFTHQSSPRAASISRADSSLLPVEVKELSFDGTNYWELWADDSGATNVSQVPATKKYSAPQWKDVDGNGSPTNTAQGERDYAIAFTRNTKPKIGAKFKIANASTLGAIKIKATGPGGITIPETAATVSGDEVTLPSLTEASSALVNTIKFYDKKDDATAFKLEWEIKLSDSGWVEVATTRHQVYLTLNDPVTALRQETLFYLGAKNADGENNADSAFGKMWADFTDWDVKNIAGKQLVYWGPKSIADEAAKKTGYVTTEYLLREVEGSCAAWASFFKLQVNAMGINGISEKDIKMVDLDINTDKIIDLFASSVYIKTWAYAQFDNKPDGVSFLKAQGNDSPPDRFKFVGYSVTLYNDRIYDPSYGKSFNNVAAWEDSSVSVYEYKDTNSPDRSVGNSFYLEQPMNSTFVE